MSSKKPFLAVASALALALGPQVVGASPVSAAETNAASSDSAHAFVSREDATPGIAPPGADETAIYLDPAGQVIPQEEELETAAWHCTPYSGRDNPHRSSTGVAVSGHGWWDKGTCENNRANVYNCLYEWYTDNTWRQKDCSSVRELAPGGGSGNRTTARRDCDNTYLTSWRNHVDVDVIGEADTADRPYRQKDVYCRVY